MKKIIAALACLTLASFAFAHSGGKNGAGCHTDHKTGGYHCH